MIVADTALGETPGTALDETSGPPLGAAAGPAGARAGVTLDANATERLRPAARDAAIAALESANPASVHAPGRAARRILEDSRERIARAFGADPDDVVLCSGGTEANAIALHGLRAGRRVLVGATEHDCVHAAAGPSAITIPVDRHGVADLDALAALLAADGTPALVALMAANNETGVLHPLAAIASLCARHGALLHVDAVQAAGRLDLASLLDEGATSLALSGHKMGALPGAGALLLGRGRTLGAALIGGAQELGRRGGTPGLPAIASWAAIADATPPDTLGTLRDAIEARATAAGAIVCGAGAARLPNTTCLALPGRSAASQVIALDLAGFAVSAGAACSSGRVSRSHVLDAMGLGPLAGEAIRASLSWSTTEADAMSFADAYARMAARASRA